MNHQWQLYGKFRGNWILMFANVRTRKHARHMAKVLRGKWYSAQSTKIVKVLK